MSKEKIRVALYLPLGSKHNSWSGLGGADKRLSFLISHMNSEVFEKYIVFRVYDDADFVCNALKAYIQEDCNIIFVTNDFEAYKHFFYAKYDYVLYDDCMVNTIPGALGALFAKSERILIFVTEYYARWSFHRKWHSLIMKFNGSVASKIDCLYPSSVSTLSKHFRKREITVTPCSLPNLSCYISSCSIEKKENIIAFVGRLVSLKNPMLLLKATNIISNEIRNNRFRVCICGLGPLENEIVDYINTNHLSDIVYFMGMQQALDIFPKAKCFCSLQENENYPSQSLLEAIACGCYCIATDVGDTHSIVNSGFGVLIDRDCNCLARQLLLFMNMNYEDYCSIYEKARTFATEQFEPMNAIHHYERICNKLRDSV